MSAPVKLPAVFAGIRDRKDKSVVLTFETQELSGQDAAVLLDMRQSYCALLIAPQASDLDNVDIPDYQPMEGQTRTPSHRLRSVLFVYWQQQGGEQVLGSFDAWYGRVVERYINLWKAKLDSGEGE